MCMSPLKHGYPPVVVKQSRTYIVHLVVLAVLCLLCLILESVPHDDRSNCPIPPAYDDIEPRRVALIIPFRDRELHLQQFREWFSDYMATNRKPIPSPHVFIVEQFDDLLFERGWLFNAGFALVTRPEHGFAVDASVRHENSRNKQETNALTEHLVDAECIQITDVDEIPTGEVSLSDCATPVQTSSEMPRYDNKVPYLQFAGANILMSRQHWEQINCFSNKYKGWGGEDDDLFLRMKAHKLLCGDCNPFCGKRDLLTNMTQVSVRRPKKGHGAVAEPKTAEGHTPRISSEKVDPVNLLTDAMEQLQQNKSSVYADGCNNAQFSLVASHEFSDSGIRYHHVRVRRTKFDIRALRLVLPGKSGAVFSSLNSSWPTLQVVADSAQRQAELSSWEPLRWYGVRAHASVSGRDVNTIITNSNSTMRLKTDHDLVVFVRSLNDSKDGIIALGDESGPFYVTVRNILKRVSL